MGPASARRIFPSVLALGAVLRLLFLNSRSLWFDETATLYISQMPFSAIPGKVAVLEENPPLHYLLMHCWEKPFPDPVFAMRLFSALCGIASLPLFHELCRRLIPKEKNWGLLFAVFSSFWIHFAQDGRIYGLLLLLGLAAAVLFLRLEERSTPGRALGYWAVCVAGLFTHNFFALLLLGHAAWIVMKGRLRASWLVLYVLVLLCWLPWLRVVIGQIRLLDRASILQETLNIRNLCHVLGTMLVDTSFLGFTHIGATELQGLLCLLFLISTTWLLRDKLGESGRFCVAQVVVPLLGLRLVEIVTHHAATQARYLIFVSPFLYILLAWGLSQPLLEAGRILRVLAVMLFAAGTAAYFTGGFAYDPHLRTLSEAIKATTSPDDMVVHLDPYWYLPMRYYYLPERTHKIAGPDFHVANWEGLPGYPSYISKNALLNIPRCVVVDPRHALLKSRVGWSSGAQVAAVAYP